MTPKVLIFTGPPSASSIIEESCTITHFETAFLTLFSLALPAAPSPPRAQYTAWRSLPLVRQPLHTGFTQAHVVDTSTLSNGAFFTTADATVLENSNLEYRAPNSQDLLTQFCEQSLGMHNLADANSESFDATESFMTSIHSAEEYVTQPCHLSDLEDVPSAKQVISLQPQTITLNLIVGVLSMAQPRTVTTRWGNTLSLIEVLVGDDTTTGFAVTFWVPSDRVAESDVVALRRQDVVLLENVALHVFRDKVYGQSLRRGLTKLRLLWRADDSGYYSSRALRSRGANPQREKTKIVRDWVLKFVGLDPQARKTRSAASWDRPPDDTQ